MLEPMRRPSGWRTMVLTAPLISDDGSSPSSRGMTATLCGIVQLSPPKPEHARSLDGGRQVLRGDPDVEVAPVEAGVLEGGVLHDRGGVALDGIAEDGDVLGGHGLCSSCAVVATPYDRHGSRVSSNHHAQRTAHPGHRPGHHQHQGHPRRPPRLRRGPGLAPDGHRVPAAGLGAAGRCRHLDGGAGVHRRGAPAGGLPCPRRHRHLQPARVGRGLGARQRNAHRARCDLAVPSLGGDL